MKKWAVFVLLSFLFVVTHSEQPPNGVVTEAKRGRWLGGASTTQNKASHSGGGSVVHRLALSSVGLAVNTQQDDDDVVVVDVVNGNGTCGANVSCGKNAVCVSESCRCLDGYYGEQCKQFNCSGVNECSGHGNCRGPDDCSCVATWSGELCDVDVFCTHNCSGHGHCLASNGTCDCEKEWEGKLCDIQSTMLRDRQKHSVTWHRVFPPLGGVLTRNGENATISGQFSGKVGQKPRARHAHSFTPLPPNLAGVVEGGVIFGGYSHDSPFADTWILTHNNNNNNNNNNTKRGSWKRIGQFETGPVPRFAHSAVVVDGSLYIYGGYETGVPPAPLGDIWKLRLDSEEWMTIPIAAVVNLINKPQPPPVPRARHAAVAVRYENREMMGIFGGVEHSGKVSADCFVFDPLSLVVKMAPTPPFGGRAGHTMTTSTNQKEIFVFGGFDASGNYNADTWLLNIEEMSWTIAESSSEGGPKPRANHVTSMHDGLMTIFGGDNGNRRFDDLWILDTINGGWSQVTTERGPPMLSHAGGGIFGPNKMCVYGGFSGGANKHYNGVWVFDFQKRAWSQPILEGDVPRPRLQQTGVVMGTDFVIFGGAKVGASEGDSQALRDVWAFGLSGLKKGKWTQIVPKHHVVVAEQGTPGDNRSPEEFKSWPIERSGHAAVTTECSGESCLPCGNRTENTVMIVYGGTDGTGVLLGEFQSYCHVTGRWQRLDNSTPNPGKRTMSAIAVAADSIFVFGGVGTGHLRLNDVWKCGLTSGSCQEIATSGWTPQKRRSMMFSLESPKSCPTNCQVKEANSILMFNGYWHANEGALKAPSGYFSTTPKRCTATRLPFTDTFCDRTCKEQPDSPQCKHYCRCKRDFVMDVWRLGVAGNTTNHWEAVHAAEGPEPRFCAQALPFEDKIWMFGGFQTENELGDFWAYDLSRNTWLPIQATEGSMTPMARHEASVDVFGSERGAPTIVMYGGVAGEGVKNELWLCEIANARDL